MHFTRPVAFCTLCPFDHACHTTKNFSLQQCSAPAWFCDRACVWGSAGRQLTIGGTSAVAPLWAAWKALTDAVAGRTLRFGPQVGCTKDVQQLGSMLSESVVRGLKAIATLLLLRSLCKKEAWV